MLLLQLQLGMNDLRGMIRAQRARARQPEGGLPDEEERVPVGEGRLVPGGKLGLGGPV